jgi:hypothetical protein
MRRRVCFPCVAGSEPQSHVCPLVRTARVAARCSRRSAAAPFTNQSNISAIQGAALFNGKAQCASCHVPPLFTEPGFNLHTPQELGIDAFQADRSPTMMYQTSPLKGCSDIQRLAYLMTL